MGMRVCSPMPQGIRLASGGYCIRRRRRAIVFADTPDVYRKRRLLHTPPPSCYRLRRYARRIIASGGYCIRRRRAIVFADTPDVYRKRHTFRNFAKSDGCDLHKRKFVLIQYSRESICMGDDAGAAIYELDIPPQTSLKQLIEILSHGGYGNTWPVPCHYNECYWLIHTNIGPVAIIICDHLEKLHVEFHKFHPDRTIQEMGRHAVYVCRPVPHWWKPIEQNNYKAFSKAS